MSSALDQHAAAAVTLARVRANATILADRLMRKDVLPTGGQRLHRGLDQLLDVAREAGHRVAQHAPEGAQTAARLMHAPNTKVDVALSAKLSCVLRPGAQVDVTRLLDAVTLEVSRAVEPVTGTAPADIDAFLRTQRELALISAAESAQARTDLDFANLHFRALTREWDAQKNEIRAILGTGSAVISAEMDASMAATPMSRSRLGVGGGLYSGGGTAFDTTQAGLARVIFYFVDAIVNDAPYPIAKHLADTYDSISDARLPQIKTCWDVIMQQVDERALVDAGNTALSLQFFYSSGDTFGQPSLRRVHLLSLMAQRAAFSLGARFTSYVALRLGRQRLVGEDWASAYVGLAHPTLAEVAVDDEHLWAKLYYCLRCTSCPGEHDVLAMSFVTRLNYPPNPVLKEVERRLKCAVDDRKYVKPFSTVTPSKTFEYAVCALLGICPNNDKMFTSPHIDNNIDNFLWLKLSVIQNEAEGLKRAALFEALQKEITDGGAKHFEADADPLNYFWILVLTAQFEQAVHFLSTKDLALAVHFAIPLYHYGILRCSPSPNAPAVCVIDASSPLHDGNRVAVCLNLAVLVLRFVRPFAATHVVAALRYYFLLRDFEPAHSDADESEASLTSLFIHCVADLCLETPEWAAILGVLDANGNRSEGAIDFLVQASPGMAQDIDNIIGKVAAESQRRGRFLDSLRLFELSKAYKPMLSLLNECLSNAITGTVASPRESALLYDFAVNVRDSPRFLGACVDDAEYSHLHYVLAVLLEFSDFFTLFGKQDFDKAYRVLSDKIAAKNFLPLKADAVDVCVQTFMVLQDDANLRRNLAQLIVWAMQTLEQRHRALKAMIPPLLRSLPAADGGRGASIEALRESARAIVSFTGRIPFRLPGPAHAELMHLQLAMA